MKKGIFAKKHKIAALIALCLVAVLCFASCGAANAPDGSGEAGSDIDWKYSASGKTLKLTGKGEMPSYKATDEIPWANVLSSVEKIEIGKDITSVGNYAFYGASALKEVEIPDTVVAIGDFAFAYCTSLEKIELSKATASVGVSAFEGCSALKDVNLHSALTSLGARAFAFCASLESVHILSAVEIKDETFFNCNALKSVVLSREITEDKVSENAFRNIDFTFSKVTFAADPNATYTVTVDFVFEDGTKADETVTLSDLKTGDAYDVEVKTKEGYVADKESVSGTVIASDVKVTVTYKAEVVETESDTATETTPADVTEEPKSNNYVALIVMVLAVVGIGVGAFLLKKSEKKNAEKEKSQNKAKNRKQK